MKKDDLMTTFSNYMELWQQVDIEYRRTPEWRMIRKFTLLNQMHRITKEYERWYNAWLKHSNIQ